LDFPCKCRCTWNSWTLLILIADISLSQGNIDDRSLTSCDSSQDQSRIPHKFQMFTFSCCSSDGLTFANIRIADFHAKSLCFSSWVRGYMRRGQRRSAPIFFLILLSTWAILWNGSRKISKHQGKWHDPIQLVSSLGWQRIERKSRTIWKEIRSLIANFSPIFHSLSG
jgi:hypothetical protein